MLANSEAFSGFAVKDLEQAKTFYADTLGLGVDVTDDQAGLMELHIAGSRDVLVYAKPDHSPANYTMLNFPVDDIDKAVDGLTERGVEFERYEGFDQDDKGVARTGPGPKIAWFTDPSGNILSVMQTD